MTFKDAPGDFANIWDVKSVNLHKTDTCPLYSFSVSLSLRLLSVFLNFFPNVSLVSCSSVPLVHSSRLEELIAGLTALVQYIAQLLPGSHTTQPSHRAIRPPSRFLCHSPLSCHTPSYQGDFVSHLSLDLSSPCLVVLSSSSCHFSFTSILPSSCSSILLSIPEVPTLPF